MKKRVFILLNVLMIFALIGIITVQVFWIRTSVKMREEQFATSVKFALSEVVKNIQKREFADNVKKYSPLLDSIQQSKESNIKDYFFQQIDTARQEIFTFRQSIVENSFKTQMSPFDTTAVSFKTFLGKEEVQIEKIEFESKEFKELSPKDRVVKVERLDRYDKLELENLFNNIVTRMPIHDRVSAHEIYLNLENELRARNIETKFEFGVFNEGLMTKVKSEGFAGDDEDIFDVSLFANNNYDLHVDFPEKKRYILAAISKILLLSALFIIIIIIAFGSALYQLIKQKKISEIKTDFINNMTHEFKTPIATINLAIDSIKNPKIIGNKEKIIRYADMIKQENRRMHTQVENVLRISRLEKNQLDLSKDVVDLHDIIDDAIAHVALIIKSEEGYIREHLKAVNSEVLVNRFHFINLITNILDNAIKYSDDAPKIDVYTENVGSNIILKIKDQGSGMAKNVQKKIFDKFYREQTGNIHNVKGHGLGLSYVKSIIEKHQGSVDVDSEKGVGSTFIVTIPLI